MAYPVPQDDPTKVVGRRVLASVLDAFLVIVPAIMLLTASFEYYDVNDLGVSGEQFCDDYLDEVGGACINAEEIDDRVYFSEDSNLSSTGVYWISNFLILVVLQGLTGWTPGKLLTGIRVRRAAGGAPGIGKAALRWILWIADGFPYVIPGLTGFIVAASTPGHRRIGDMAANTFVVKRAAFHVPITIEDGGRLIVGEPAAAAPLGWAPPPTTPGAPGGWGPAIDPSAAGWASPDAGAPASPSDAPPAAAPAPAPSAEGPQWDEARGTYIQWDPAQRAWMQWDEGFKAWTRIPGQ
jgi:uncharacterized RDD family membrane protein YckC